MKTARKYYFAYGSNCNLDQMAQRCPEAMVYGSATLPSYTLIFNGVASIKPRSGAEVKGVLWEITPKCEQSLDKYEGYPHFYEKKNITVQTTGGSSLRAMVYIMTPEHDHPAPPTEQYYNGIAEGFEQNGIPIDTLEAALLETHEKMKPGGMDYAEAALQ